MMNNVTVPIMDPKWNSKPAWKLPAWAEPIIVASILFFAMFMTRRRNFRIFDTRSRPSSPLDYFDLHSSSSRLIPYESDSEPNYDHHHATTTKFPSKRRKCLGFSISTPNTSRFRNNIHSRTLQRFPFLNEMLYWFVNYVFYRLTAVASHKLFASSGIWNAAQEHGIAVLEAEEYGWLKFLFPIRERQVQQWFIHSHPDALTVLNKAYALIHIPGTVGFICWYYYVAPSFNTFAIARRTMTLTNFFAFITFIVHPCMPPRLLPREYGFLDTVRHDDAQSVWMSGKYVNTLAAMPSMHFGYAFCIGMAIVYHSGVCRTQLERGEARKSDFWKIVYVTLGVGYPSFILTVIVATANHYYIDALVAAGFVLVAFFCNKIFYVFIPLEDLFMYVLRAEKPTPTTGDRYHGKGGRL